MLHTIVRHTPVSLLIITLLFSGLLTIATAQETSGQETVPPATDARQRRGTSTPIRDMKGQMDAKRQEFQARAAELRANAEKRKEALTTRMAERRTRIAENVENRVRTVVSNMKSRMNHIIDKLTAIADRIEARANGLKERGVSVDATLSLLEEARAELRAASVIINDDLDAEVDTAVTDESPKMGFSYIKESVGEAKEHIRTAHQKLKDAMVALKTAGAAREQKTSEGAPRQ